MGKLPVARRTLSLPLGQWHNSKGRSLEARAGLGQQLSMENAWVEVPRQLRVACAGHLLAGGGWELGEGCSRPAWTWFCAPSTVDLLEWNRLVDIRTKLSRPLVVPNMQVGTHLCYLWGSPTGRAWGSKVWVCCPQVLAGSSDGGWPGAGHAVIYQLRLPGWRGGHCVRAELGAGQAGWTAALGMGSLWEVFVSLGPGGCGQGGTSSSPLRAGSLSLCCHASARRRTCRCRGCCSAWRSWPR